jgi:thiamine-monophosphate kinase
MGEVQVGKAIKRNGAKISDEIWVSGKLGDAALALQYLQGKITLPEDVFINCAKSLHTPQPRVTLGLTLQEIANSAIDISDGLLADLGHILEQSNVGATLDLKSIPHSTFVDFPIDLHDDDFRKIVLAGGDDYELCFTAPAAKHEKIIEIGENIKLKLSCIGRITTNPGLKLLGFENDIIDLKETGFDHFS